MSELEQREELKRLADRAMDEYADAFLRHKTIVEEIERTEAKLPVLREALPEAEKRLAQAQANLLHHAARSPRP